MNRAAATACTLLAAFCLGGCGPMGTRARGREEARTLSPEGHRELSNVAADVALGLRQRLEADEPMTPEFVTLICEWQRREYVHSAAAAADASGRRAAARDYWRKAEWTYVIFDRAFDLVAPLQHAIAEYGLRSAELALAGAGADAPPSDDAWSVEPGRSGRSHVAVARDILRLMREHVESGGAPAAEFVEEICEASRRLCLTRMCSATNDPERLRAAEEHAREVARWLSWTRGRNTIDVPSLRHRLDFLNTEAKLWAAQAGARNLPAQPRLRSAMAAAARAHVAYLQKRQEAEEPLSIEFVEEICVWSRRSWQAERASSRTRESVALADHRQRMRDLHGRISRIYDEGGDVSRIEVSQSAYFLREAELSVR